MNCKILFCSIIFFVTQKVLAQNPLFIPDTLSGTNFYLDVHADTHEFYPGYQTDTYGISASYLAPVLFLKKGDVVSLNVANNLADATTMHWHGLHIAPENDGGPHTPIAPGTVWNPQFEVMNAAGTFWYHPHLHEHTNEQVSKGAAGMIIVRDNIEATLPLPRHYGSDDIPIILQTKPFNTIKQIPLNSHMDSVALVNGTRKAVWQAPAQVVRFRLLNAATDRTFLLGFDANMPFYQIATDAGLMQNPIMLTRLRLAPGERAEILVDLTNKQGQTIWLKSIASELPTGIIGAASVGNGMMQLEGYAGNPINGSDFNFLKIEVGAPTANAITQMPTSLVSLSHPSAADAQTNRTITFEPQGGMMMGVNGPFQFNGQAFDMDVINYTIPLGNTEVWTLNNQTMIAHPFHIHDIAFWLLERNGQTVPASEQGWKDVVLVMPMSTVKFITTFTDFANPNVPYMYHCHVLLHEDEGMMGQFVVVNPEGVQDTNLAANLHLSPNPATEQLNISVTLPKQTETTLTVFNTLSQLIFSTSFNNTNSINYLLNTNTYAKGIYYLRITQNGQSTTAKFVK